jgi:hypothetical protein
MSCEFEICKDLRPMDWIESLNGFHLDDQPSVNQEIQPKARWETGSLVVDWQADLPFHFESIQPQLSTECRLIYRFEQSRPQVTMNLDCRTNHRMSKPPVAFLCVLRALCASVVNHHRRLTCTRPRGNAWEREWAQNYAGR